MNISRSIIVVIFLFKVTQLFSINVVNPNVVNISSYDYNSGNKNWDISQDSKGFIYVANNDGLLKYDGLSWKKYEIEMCPIIRSVEVDLNDDVYTGGFEEFGVWSKNNKGKLLYKSLSNKIDQDVLRNSEIWRIFVTDSGVFFQSFSKVFFYNKKSEVKVIDPKRFIFLMNQVNDRLLIESESNLMEVSKGGISVIAGLNVSSISVILPFKGKQLLLASQKNGLLIFDGKKTTRWKTKANDIIKEYSVNCGIELDNGNYLLGTLINGMYEVSKSGEVINHYNTDNFLQNNTVLSLFKDRDKNIWVGLDNGISRLIYNSKFSYYIDPKGSIGSVYSSAFYNNRLYIGTNRGLFYVPEKYLNKLDALSEAIFVPEVSEQVWRLKVVDNQLIVGFNKGAIRITKNKTEKIVDNSGVLSINEIYVGKEKQILLSTYSRLILLKKSDNGLYVLDKILGEFDNPCTYAEIDFKGNIWLVHQTKGAFKCNFNYDEKRIDKITPVSTLGLGESDSKIRIGKLDGRVVFIVNDRFYTYNDINNKIEPYKLLNDIDISVNGVNNIVEFGNNNYCLIGENSYAIINCNEDEVSVLEQHNFYGRNVSTVDGYEDVVLLNDSISLFCLNNGFMLKDTETDTAENIEPRDIILNHVVTTDSYGKKDTLKIFPEFNSKKIAYDYHNIEFLFSYPFVANKNWRFQHKMEGLSMNWSQTYRESSAKFERLGSGKYNFKLRIVDELGKPVKSVNYSFIILRPWYISNFLIFIYTLILILVVVLIRRYNRNKRIRLQNEETKRQENLRMKEYNKMLKSTVKNRNEQLSNTAAATIQKNDMLEKVKSELNSFRDSHSKLKYVEVLYRNIMKHLDEKEIAKEDWKLFMLCFENAHENFLKDVKTKFPDLSSNDLKFCICARLNLSTKETASLLSISIRGVEVGRYRLRKKINLDSNISMSDYFINNFE